MRVAGIIFSNLNDNTLSRLTADRTVAAIPFGCRYTLVDFPLSGMVNAGIENISIVANYNYRSLAEHIGSGKDWDLARRSGGIKLISPYQTSRSAHVSMYSHHLEALKSMYEYIEEFKEDTVVLSDCTNICNLDLKKVLQYHWDRDADMTFVTTPCTSSFTAKSPQVMFAADGDSRIQKAVKSNHYIAEYPERFISVFVMKTVFLRKMVEEAFSCNYNSMTDEILLKDLSGRKFYTYNYDGYVAPVSSFLDYYTHSMELTENEAALKSLLMDRERPIFTRVHNSSPCKYGKEAKVVRSIIADDCVIEGTVENSIIFRGVKVEKGARVSNCVLFAGTTVGENSSLNCVVTDKDVLIHDDVNLGGSKNLPFYISRGRKV